MGQKRRRKRKSHSSKKSATAAKTIFLLLYSSDKLAIFKIKELKDILSQLGLSKQGKKQDLLDRLIEILSDEQGTRRIKRCEPWLSMSHIFRRMPKLTTQKNSKHLGTNRKLSVCAEYSDGDRDGSSDFLAGFLFGGAVFGTVAYIFAPQIRRSLLNEDESGFRRAKRPMYYDEGLEKTRETLNSKINQLNSAIDNVSSRLRGGNNSPTVPIEIKTDPEVETTF